LFKTLEALLLDGETAPSNPRRGSASQLLVRQASTRVNNTSNYIQPLPKGAGAMKVFSANIQDLRTLYFSNLKKALDMEQKITKALPISSRRLPIPNSSRLSKPI
jgi:hypothetical protein